MKKKLYIKYFFRILLMCSLIFIIKKNNMHIELDVPYVKNGETCLDVYYKTPKKNQTTSRWIIEDIENYDNKIDGNGIGTAILELSPGNKLILNEEGKIMIHAAYTDTIIPLYEDDLNEWKEKLSLKQVGDEYTVGEYVNIQEVRPLEFKIIPKEKIIGSFESCKEKND